MRPARAYGLKKFGHEALGQQRMQGFAASWVSGFFRFWVSGFDRFSAPAKRGFFVRTGLRTWAVRTNQKTMVPL